MIFARTHWDRIPAEVHGLVLAAAGPLTRISTGRAVASDLSPGDARSAWEEALRISWRGDVRRLPAVPDLDPALFGRTSSRELVVGAARLPWINRECILYAAVANQWPDLLGGVDSATLLPIAAKLGASWLASSIVASGAASPSVDDVVCAAAAGHLAVIEILVPALPPSQWAAVVGAAIAAAAASGFYQVAAWFAEHHHDLSIDPILKATVPTKTRILNHVVPKCMHLEQFPFRFLLCAATWGYAHVLEWFLREPSLAAQQQPSAQLSLSPPSVPLSPTPVSPPPLPHQIHNSHLFTPNIVGQALQSNHAAVRSFLFDNGLVGLNREVAGAALFTGDLTLLESFRASSRLDVVSAADPDLAAASGAVATLQWLQTHIPATSFSADALSMAALYDKPDALRWLIENVRCVDWDIQHAFDQTSPGSLCRPILRELAAQQGFSIVVGLYQASSRGGSSMDMTNAASDPMSEFDDASSMAASAEDSSETFHNVMIPS
ncbi:hypothetical protein HK105_206252 [Polyrhizophydium stewartii]|uniref:Ankyrin repeat protein n=1 Tax=Polyrhizophydium stewartii TaxID=2732419 RepID=A0ABR4N440_9FUNG